MARPKTQTRAQAEIKARAQAEMELRSRALNALRMRWRKDPIGYCSGRFGGKVWRKEGDEIGHDGEIYTVGQEEILLSVRDYVTTGVESANGTGKTFIASRAIAWFLDCYGTSPDGKPEECEIYVIAAPPASNLERIWSEVQRLCSSFPGVFSAEPTSEKLKIGPKTFVQTIPIPVNATPEKRKESFGGKHAKHIFFIIDEANSVDEPIWQVIENEGMATGLMVRCLFFYNPRSRFGPAYNRFHGGRCNPISLSAFDHPNVLSGKPVIESGMSQAWIAMRIATETRPWAEGEPWNDMCFELPEHLVGKSGTDKTGNPTEPLPPGPRVVIVDHLMDGSFNYAVRGVAPLVTADVLIPEPAIVEARARWDRYMAQHKAPPAIRPILGFDVATTTDKNALLARYDEFVAMPETWMPPGGIDPIKSCDHVVRRFFDLNARVVNVDDNGLGEACPPYLRLKGVNAKGYKGSRTAPKGTIDIEVEQEQKTRRMSVSIEFNDMRDWLLWRVRMWVLGGGMLPPCDKLIEALLKLTYSKDSHGRIEIVDAAVHKKRLGFSPDELVALSLTFAPEGGGGVSFLVSGPLPASVANQDQSPIAPIL